MANDIAPVTFTAEDGTELSAERLTPPDPTVSAVICHPHPLHGGNMYNNVVSELFHRLAAAGVDCLRFDFRGVGGSGGSHGEGEAERDDVASAIAHQVEVRPELPVVLAGYSFGADVALTVTHERLAAWIAVAPPLRIFPLERMVAGPDPRPVLVISGTADDFRPADQVAAKAEGWTGLTVETVEGANHFFPTGLDRVGSAAEALVTSLT